LQSVHIQFIIMSFVELAGVEPASKQETGVVSTCLFCYWFSCQGWKQTSDP